MSPRKSTLGKSLCESFEFSEGIIGVTKIAFSLERLSGQIFLTESGGTFFAGFCPGVVLSWAKKKIYREKPHRNSVSKNWSKVRRNTSPQEHWKNYANSRQWQAYF